MKIKYIIAAVLTTASLGIFTSCDDLLESKNFTEMTNTGFPSSASDINALVTGLYSPCTTNWGYGDGGWRQGLFNVDKNAMLAGQWMTTDIMVGYFTGDALEDFTFGPATGGAMDHVYHLVRFIARATEIIGSTEKCEAVSEGEKARYIAEIKTLRAYYLYVLLDWFGPVNAIVKYEDLGSNEVMPRPSMSDYVAQIIHDCDDAIATPNFPDKYNDDYNNWGRMSKNIAHAIKLRTYMHQKDWTEGKKVCETLMEKGYSIYPNYEELFNSDATCENIWSIPSIEGGQDNLFLMEVLPGDFKAGFNLKNRRYIRGTEDNYLSGWYVYCMRWDFYDTFSDDDKRKETILCEYENTSGERVRREKMIGALPIKFMDSEFATATCNKAFPVIRYAEVLLDYAEIINELQGPVQAAFDAIKPIVDRAGIEIPAEAKVDKEAFKDFLLAERGRELYCEGSRRTDLIRHGKFISGAISRGKKAHDYQQLFPIPSWVIIEAGGKLEQNPGYAN